MSADPHREAAAAAASLLRAPIDAIEPARGIGRNSRVYRVRSGGAWFALKHYPPHEARGRDRLGTELRALDLMRDGGIASVPRVIAGDPARGCALLEWIEGAVPPAPAEEDIDAAIGFLAQVHALRLLPAAREQPLAAEACLSGGEVVAQIGRRIARLGGLAGEAELAAFLVDEARPLLESIAAWAEAEYTANGLAFARDIPEARRTLCPSDFGFHNALRRPDGHLAFIDFDYFGWDDPAKLVCDFLLHPGMALPESLKGRFAAAIATVYGADDPAFGVRLRALYPLFGLRWCMILLNEFLPERWELRVHAGERAEWEAAKRRQLDRARDWVQILAANFRMFPYA